MDRLARVLARSAPVAIVHGLAIIHAGGNGYDPLEAGRVMTIAAYSALLILSSYACGIPDLPENARQAWRASATATGIVVIGISLLQLVTGLELLPRFVVLGATVGLTSIYVSACKISMDARARRRSRDKVLLVGNREEAAELTEELAGATQKPACLVAFLAWDKVADPDSLLKASGIYSPTVIVLSRNAEIEPAIVSQAAELHLRGIRIRSIAGFWEEWLGKLPVSELERRSLFFDISELHSRPYRPLKRLLDIVAGAAGLAVVLPIMPVVAGLNLLWNRGPLFYRQVRTGKGGTPITIFKFRTMKAGPGADSVWTVEGDERVTPFGRILRATHLDELPQVLNLLHGDLSVVGPRPEQPHYVAELSEKIPFYDVRHAVSPGLTGWAQVNFAYAASTADAIQKLQYEFYYLRHQRLLLDLQIIGRTVRSVLRRSGR